MKMSYLNNTRGFNRNMFSVKRIILEEPVEEEVDDEEETVIIRPKKTKGKQRLPGEKLLRQLHKMRLKEQ